MEKSINSSGIVLATRYAGDAVVCDLVNGGTRGRARITYLME